jgi:hypothetical protein
MPVTARLLNRLQETLGAEATQDLLVWWEEGTAVQRAEVREIADLYFQRFSAELQRGLGEVRTELRGEFQKGQVDLRAEFQKGIADLRTEMANQRADLLKWMFIFWAGTVIPLAGLAVALAKL